jgi:hypothetical protein
MFVSFPQFPMSPWSPCSKLGQADCLALNMKDINKIWARHTSNAKKKNVKKNHIFAKSCPYDAVGSLPVMPSILSNGFWGRSQVSLFFASVMSPDYTWLLTFLAWHRLLPYTRDYWEHVIGQLAFINFIVKWQ